MVMQLYIGFIGGTNCKIFQVQSLCSGNYNCVIFCDVIFHRSVAAFSQQLPRAQMRSCAIIYLIYTFS